MFRPSVEAGAVAAAAAATPSQDDMLSANALRIADLLSQLEQSSAELKRLRSRASRAHGKPARAPRAPRPRAPKSPTSRPRKTARSPRRTQMTPPTQTPSPTSIVFAACVDFDALSADPVFNSLGSDCKPAAPATPATPRSHGHWSAAEVGRFEAAAARFDAGSWALIAAEVGSRSEKQVRAFAARRRRSGGSVRPGVIAARFAALDIPVPHAQERSSIETELLQMDAAAAAAFAPQKAQLPLDIREQHPAATATGSLELLSSSSSEALMGEFEVCTPTLDYPDNAGAGFDLSGRGATIESMDAFAFEESFFQTAEKRAAGKQIGHQQQQQQQQQAGAFDWNCYPMAEAYEMPVDFTESFLMMEHI